MRELLAPLVGYRHRFCAVAARLGTAEDGQLTVLLRDVMWTGGSLIDTHMWIGYEDALGCIRARMGERIAFTAIARPYRRKNDTRDYTLSQVDDVRLLSAKRDRRGGRR